METAERGSRELGEGTEAFHVRQALVVSNFCFCLCISVEEQEAEQSGKVRGNIAA